MANQFNRYQEELARRGLGSVFQTEGPERVGAGQRFTRSFDNREAGRANLTDVYGPDIPPYLMENIFNVGGLLDQIVSAGSEAITPPITTADRRQQSAAIRREAGAPKTGLEEAEFFPSGLDPDKGQIPEDFVPFQPPKDWNVIEAKEPPKAGVPRIGEGPKKSMLAGGRGTVIEKPGERAAATADPIEQAFSSAMSEYINAARSDDGGVKVRSLEDYKKEFAEATGIDISGKVDKSQALMAFGLALMQNRAGKGFNVGRMLSAVGEAGEAALPALEKAKQESKANAAAAGKYALEMRSSDRAKAEAAKEKAMSRQNYYIVPKGEGVSGFLANVDKGSIQPLNVYELNKLQSNPDFANKYDILPGAMWGSIVQEAMKTPKAKEFYLEKPREVTLYEGTDAEIKFQVFDPTAAEAMNGRRSFTYESKAAYDKIADQLNDLEKAEREWADITAQIQERGVNVYTQTLDGADSLFEAFGINFREGETPTARLRNFLTRMQMQNAPEILGEAGKTISDADRQRVAAIVGDVSLLTSEDELLAKMEQVHKFIVGRTRQNIMRSLREIDRYSPNSNFSQYLQGDESMSDEEKERLSAYNKKYGYEG
jgi:hypothetical protein